MGRQSPRRLRKRAAEHADHGRPAPGIGGSCQSCGTTVGAACCSGRGSGVGPSYLECATGLTCQANKCEPAPAPPTCGVPGLSCCTTGKPCTTSNTACNKIGKCVATKVAPPDAPGCGQIGAPAYKCCHNRKNACDLGGVCNTYGDCAPAAQKGACASGAPVPVTICVTTDNSSEVYSGEWCSDADATSFYANWCNGLKTDHGYTKCEVGEVGGLCPP